LNPCHRISNGRDFSFSNGASATNEYVYDNNGNLTKDSNKGITNIAYNSLNLPSKVTFSDGSTIVYSYSADGTKLRTVHVINGTSTQKDYCANVVYENGIQKMLLTEDGYVDLSASTPTYYYYLKDHQGNNRVVVNSSGTVQETNHYYPFGGVFASIGNVQPYKYNGKELDTKKGLNWYDYGARHYDATLGRWFVVDPLAEKYYAWSPYAYCLNNPAGLIDEEGKSPISVFAKYMAKQGVKSQLKRYVKNTIQRRLEKYMSKDMMKQFIQDVDDVTNILDNTWQENLIELIPGVGDVYGAGKFGKKIADAYRKLQELENKYVGKIYDSLGSDELKDKFKKNMRRNGVLDARRDQKAGVKVKGEIYEKGKSIDGHHIIKVSDDASKMTDPENIRFMIRKEHIKLHQNE
jgi:RHS repeat-associated protein